MKIGSSKILTKHYMMNQTEERNKYGRPVKIRKKGRTAAACKNEEAVYAISWL